MTTAEDIDKVDKPLVMKDVAAARAAIEKAVQLEMAGERGWKGAYKQVLDSVGLSKIVRCATFPASPCTAQRAYSNFSCCSNLSPFLLSVLSLSFPT
jgi:hypothetical protein